MTNGQTETNLVKVLRSELKITQKTLRDCQIEGEKVKKILQQNMRDCQSYETASIGYKKISDERDRLKCRSKKLALHVTTLKTELEKLRNELNYKELELFDLMKSKASNSIKLGTMFLKMRASKAVAVEKRKQFEEMCAELIIHMKEQSDLMKYVTENVDPNTFQVNERFLFYKFFYS